MLLSGGIDSATTIAAYKQQGGTVGAVFFDYGQPALRSEFRAAKAIARHYRIKLRQVRIGTRLRVRDGEFFGRNAIFGLLAAAMEGGDGALVIAAGLHAGSPYYDTTTPFVADLQRLFDGYSSGSVRFAAPFLESTKAELVGFARRHRVPLSLTYSCESKNAPVCGKCRSCLDRVALDVD